MALRDAILGGVKSVNNVTKSLQSTVRFSRAVKSTDGYSRTTYPTTVTLPALVDWKQKQLRTESGALSVSRAVITFVDVAALSAATGGLGIDMEDRIVLQDGTTGPILDMGGYIDPGTNIPFATEVYLG